MKNINRISFYTKVILRWIEDRNSSLLVVAGNMNDRNIFYNLNFRNVVISNIDSRLKGDEFAPFQWSFQNAENIDYKSGEFDYVVVYAGLHHCSSPHRVLLEMYRVARRAIIIIESRDSTVMRVMQRLKFTSSYETKSVYDNDFKYGGVNNTDIPNFIYRWTEREIEKTISSYAPYANHRFHYCYGNDATALASRLKNNKIKSLIVSIAAPIYKAFVFLFPRQQNYFACKIEKPIEPGDLYKWITFDDGGKKIYNKEWAHKTYR